MYPLRSAGVKEPTGCAFILSAWVFRRPIYGLTHSEKTIPPLGSLWERKPIQSFWDVSYENVLYPTRWSTWFKSSPTSSAPKLLLPQVHQSSKSMGARSTCCHSQRLARRRWPMIRALWNSPSTRVSRRARFIGLQGRIRRLSSAGLTRRCLWIRSR